MASQNRPMFKPEPQSPDKAAEAARYAVLRRIGPALKHDLVVNLQAVAMMAEVLGARLDKAAPTPGELRHHIERIHRMAREAVANSLKVAAWLAPGEDDGVSLHEGVRDALDLVRSNFGFRGFSLDAQLPEADLEVSRGLLRHLLLAALIELSDEADEPALLVVHVEVGSDAALLSVQRLARTDGVVEQPLVDETGYRRLDADDVRALADAASAQLRSEPGRITVRIPRLVATSPLQIAPR